MNFTKTLAFVLPVLIGLSTFAHAHFLWLVESRGNQGLQVQLCFNEQAEPGEPELLDRVKGATLWQLLPGGKAEKVELHKGPGSWNTLWNEKESPEAIYALSHNFGVIERGGETFLLRYHAKTGPDLGHDSWKKVDCGKYVDLDLVPARSGDQLRLKILFRGKPAADAQVKITGEGIADAELISDKDGAAPFALGKTGRYTMRARHIEKSAGEYEGKAYGSVRHYATLTLYASGKDGAAASNAKSETQSATKEPMTKKSESPFPPIPQMVTSFGAAVLDDALYIYGGHTGHAHTYSNKLQAHELRRLDLKNPKAWETLASGPRLQGLAMIGYAGKLYRIGGFSALNNEGEKQDMHSTAEVACFDLKAKEWREMPPLPEPRSSHDAALIGDKIYVAGGWQLRGQEDSIWHKTAYVMSLSAKPPTWERLPEPPFQRRAISLAAYQGKLYVVGGMMPDGSTVTRVDIFDPATSTWSQGPNLLGEPLEGFGTSSFATNGRMYVSTMKGTLQRLSANGTKWESVRQLETARFFHRMVPADAKHLIIVGGANMTTGKFAELDLVDVE